MTDDIDNLFADDDNSDESPPADEAQQSNTPAFASHLPDVWKVLIVDDDEEIHLVTKLVLSTFKFKGVPLQMMNAYSGAEAIETIKNNPDIALVLLDIVMESDHAGLEVVKAVRGEAVNNQLIRIVLRTGQPGQAPEKDIIEQYDINDYKDKTELTSQKLVTLMYSVLRSYNDIQEIFKTKKDLEAYYEKTVKELDLSKRHIFNIIDSMPSLLIGINTEQQITDWNMQAHTMTDISADQAFGEDVFETLSCTKQFKAEIEDTLANQTRHQAERVMVTINRQQRYFDIEIYPVKIGDTSGAVLRMDDITKRIQKDNMMVQSEKMVTVGNLAKGMVEEIQLPIGLIIQNAQNILKRVQADVPANTSAAQTIGLDFEQLRAYLEERKIIKFVENMQNAAEQAQEITNKVLGFGSADDIDIKFEPIDSIMSKVKSCVTRESTLKEIYGEDCSHVLFEVDDPNAEIPCIAGQLVQVIVNIIRFASHLASDDPQVTIKIEKLSDQFHLQIRDNGKGLSEEAAKKVFSGLSEESSNNYSNSLSMSVSHYIITEQHNGTISLSCQPDHGCTFDIHLPSEARKHTFD